jgi:hypothetical protein
MERWGGGQTLFFPRTKNGFTLDQRAYKHPLTLLLETIRQFSSIFNINYSEITNNHSIYSNISITAVSKITVVLCSYYFKFAPATDCIGQIFLPGKLTFYSRF